MELGCCGETEVTFLGVLNAVVCRAGWGAGLTVRLVWAGVCKTLWEVLGVSWVMLQCPRVVVVGWMVVEIVTGAEGSCHGESAGACVASRLRKLSCELESCVVVHRGKLL